MTRSLRVVLLLVLIALAVTREVTEARGASVITNEDIQARLRAGKFAAAEKLARVRLSAVEAGSGPDSVAVADVLDVLSESMRLGGKGGQAELGEICKRAVRIKEKQLGKDDPGYAASLYQLGSWYYVNGEYRDARPFLERSLKIREEKLGPDHPSVATSLLMMGALETDEGDHASAKALVERSLAIREAIDSDGPGVAECSSCLASILVRMGDYASAEPLFRRAIDIWGSRWGTSHPKVATGWNNLSTLQYATGDFDGALTSKEKALAIRIRTLGPNHELVAWTRANMGMNLAALGRKTDARRQYQDAIAIQERRFGRDSPEVGWTLKRLGDTYLAPGEYRQAIPILERALLNLRSGEPGDHPDIGEAMAALGAAHTALGDTASGNDLNRRALALLTRRLGDQHPEVGFTLTQHAAALAAANLSDAALEVALQGEDVSREHLRLTCRSMPERAALAYAASRPAGGRLALSLLGRVTDPDQQTLTRVWDSLIRSRTLVLDEMTMRMQMASETNDAETRRLVQDLAYARRRLANLIVSGPGETTGDRYRSTLEEARERNEGAERALAKASALFSEGQKRVNLGFREVVASLPAGTAIVSYATAGEGGDRSYVAFVTDSRSEEVSFVPIAAASRVERAVSRWLTAVSTVGHHPTKDALTLSHSSGDSLADLVWLPIAKRVEHARQVFIVGDGAILLVNFDALPVDRSRYLVEVGPTLHYLNSERDLVVLPTESKSGTGLLAVGDPAFDRRETSGEIAKSRGAAHRDAWDCSDFRSVRFSRLPNSGAEVREIAKIWGDGGHTTLLTGAAANERAFKAHAPGHRVLHLATHGFFLGGTCEQSSPNARGIGGTSPLGKGLTKVNAVSPTQLSGLALAGANERALTGPNEEDGVLTAEEIASLNLGGTDWAVLSACDTGRGRIQVGEGVLGLRRAFQAAGARTVIMSLWAVDDESTREWMDALYLGRVKKKLDTADAVRQADLNVLRARRAQALSTDPFYWAAFVATGDWR